MKIAIWVLSLVLFLMMLFTYILSIEYASTPTINELSVGKIEVTNPEGTKIIITDFKGKYDSRTLTHILNLINNEN